MTALEIIDAYVADVIAGRKLAGKLERLACERHLRDIEASKRKNAVYYFDDDEACDVVEFFTYLNHWKGDLAGQLIQLEPWQVFVVCSVLCWKRKATHLRRFRESYVEIPRKNGKTTVSAGVGLYLFCADGEPGAEIYTAATKLAQAKLAHEDAKQFIQRSPVFRDRFAVLRDNIADIISGSKYEPLGRDASGLDGLNVHGAIIDEFHAHKSSELYDVIKSGTGARSQPLLFVITTAGFLLEGPCKQRHDLSIEILEDRIQDDEMFVYIACPDDGDDWREVDTWKKANPNYGVSVNPDDLERAARNAQNLTSEQVNFLTKRLNIWVGQSERWLDMELWSVCHDQTPDDFGDRPVWGGLDLSSTSDVTACVWVSPADDDWNYDVQARLWVPVDSAIIRERRDRVPYRAWEREGWLELTEGNVLDFDHIRATITADASRHNVQSIAFDPWSCAQMAQDLDVAGITLEQFRQGYASMSEPCKLFDRLMRQGRLRIGGNPVMRWMAGNVAIDIDPAGNIKPAKDKSGDKIDGIVSLIMALGSCVSGDSGESVYASRGVLVL